MLWLCLCSVLSLEYLLQEHERGKGEKWEKKEKKEEVKVKTERRSYGNYISLEQCPRKQINYGILRGVWVCYGWSNLI